MSETEIMYLILEALPPKFYLMSNNTFNKIQNNIQKIKSARTTANGQFESSYRRNRNNKYRSNIEKIIIEQFKMITVIILIIIMTEF